MLLLLPTLAALCPGTRLKVGGVLGVFVRRTACLAEPKAVVGYQAVFMVLSAARMEDNNFPEPRPCLESPVKLSIGDIP